MSQQRLAQGQEGRPRLRPAAHRRPREDQARPAAEHQQDLPRRLLPPARRRRRQAVQLLLRHRSRSTTRSSATSRRPRPTPESLKAYAEKSAAARRSKNYGIVFDTLGQDHRRQPGRDRRAGLQERRQGLRRRRPDRLQGPLEHRRAVGRPQVGRQAGPRQRHPDEADAAHGRRDVRLARPGPPGELQAAHRQHPRPRRAASPRPRKSCSRASTRTPPAPTCSRSFD